MKDVNGSNLYYVQYLRQRHILDCYTGAVVRTSRARFTTRTDADGQQIVGAKVTMTDRI